MAYGVGRLAAGAVLLCALACADPGLAPEATLGASTEALEAFDDHRTYALTLALDLPIALDLEARRARVAEAQAELLADVDGIEVVWRFALVPGLAVRLRDPAALDALRAHPGVRGVGPDEGGAGHLNQSAPFVGAPTVHAQGRRGQGRRVAVVDTGVDTDHPDLVGDLVAGACFCTNGTNCCGPSGSTGTTLSSAEDDNGHGTHVSGIISSAGAVAPLGIAPDADLVVVRVMRNNQFASTSDLIAALEWVRINHPSVDAVNMSLGTTALFPPSCELPGPGYTPPPFMLNLRVAFDLLRAAGIVPVVSAGNAGDRTRSGSPGCLSNAFTVGASANAANTVTGFTNSNAGIDVWAPGASISSSHLLGAVASLNGTSMSAPHVTAAAALARQANAFHPAAALEACLRTSPVEITDPANGIRRPRLDVAAAVAACGAFALGAGCSVAGECASGFCADGVCCNQACGGAAVDCLGCSRAAGAAVDGTCGLASPGTECRPSVGLCDVAETCSGATASCPGDAVLVAGFECRASAGACDLREVCTGASGTCPPDGKFGGVCRPPAGPCDRPEACNGVNDDCPTDELWGTSIECRPARGGCDAAEVCTGTDVACPADVLLSGECRPAVGPCDVAERCDGVSFACPSDGWAATTDVCRPAAGPCDRPEFCDGASTTCPADGKRTSICRAAAGLCDIAERCDGVLDACPADGFSPFGAECRESAGECDVAEACTGFSPDCPQDRLRIGVCRPAAGACDRVEACDGVSVDCGPDRVASSTVTCRAAAGACDAVEVCDGAGVECPGDVAAPDGQRCEDGVTCNGTETCRGGACAPGEALDCEAASPCEVGVCEEPGGCRVEPVMGCCTADADCDDLDECTIDRCEVATGACGHAPDPACCAVDADCHDGDACTDDACVDRACVITAREDCCRSDADCPRGTVTCAYFTCDEDNVCRESVIADCEGGPPEPACTCRDVASAEGAPPWAAWFALALLAATRRRRRSR